MFEITEELPHDNSSISSLLRNELSTIKREINSPKAGNSPFGQDNDSDYEKSLNDFPITQVKVEALDDAPVPEDEGSGGPVCSPHTSARTKQELDIGPTELHPPDIHFMLLPCKSDPGYEEHSQSTEDTPRGRELLLPGGGESTQQPSNHLPIQSAPNNQHNESRVSKSQHGMKQVKIVPEPAHADVSDRTPTSIDLPNQTLKPATSQATWEISRRRDKKISIVSNLDATSSTNVNMFECDFCHKEFSGKYKFQSHVLSHGHDFQSLKKYDQLSQQNIARNNSSKKLHCDLCQKQFSISSLIAHMKVHMFEKSSQADICCKRHDQHMQMHNVKYSECKYRGQRISDNLGVVSDLGKKVHTSKTSLECRVYVTKLKTSSEFIQHLPINVGEKKRFACKFCAKRFTRNSALIAHARVHTGEKPFECKICNKSFSVNSSLTTHARVHTGEKYFECYCCGKSFNRSTTLTAHMRVHTGEKPFKCNICAKTFRANSDLTVHMPIHFGERPFECNVCAKKFKIKSRLVVHMRIHNVGQLFKCKVCAKMFKLRSDLTKHSRQMHIGEMPFGCKFCAKRFSCNSFLTAHERMHTGEKPFKCNICAKTFRLNSDLTVHRRIHTGEKPFECKVCAKHFRKNCELTIHTRIHTGEKPYKCKLCAKSFRQSCTLTRHLITHAGERPF